MGLPEDSKTNDDPHLDYNTYESEKKEMPAANFTIVGDDDHEDDDDNLASSWSQRKIYKNLLLISSAFLFIFTAFQALSNLQSSINCDEGLGLASLSTIYATLIVSAMLLPSLLIRHLGLKWTLVISASCYVVYTAANFYSAWATLIPASVLLGLGAAPLWTAKSTYLTTMAGAFSKLTGETVPSIVSRFWGIFFLFFQSSQILGNLISSLVFRQDTTFVNGSDYKCGSQDCYTETGDSNSSYCDPPDQNLTYTLLSIYLVSGVIAVIIVIAFVDSLGASRKIRDQGTFDLFFATTRLMKDKKMILIIPLTIYSGLEQAFITGDFTKSYVTCSLGVGWVGYIMICYGIADATCSVLFGRLVKYTGTAGQIPFFCLGAVINVALVVVLFVWEPSQELPVFFVIAAMWGVADAVWQTQLNALYGIVFQDLQEQAYSNYRLWESIGFTVAFAYSNFLCVWIKLTVLVCVLGVGMLGYAGVEITMRRN